jgi:citrate/tricarballylate utilization protein
MAQVRVQTYADFAWPPALGALYQRNGLTLSLALAAGLALFLLMALAINGTLTGGDLDGNFYKLFPHNLLVGLFVPGVRISRCWRWPWACAGSGAIFRWRPSGAPLNGLAAAEAADNVLRLKYLGGGHGKGCNNADDAWTLWRRRFHHATFYGFMLCFAATSVATLYHYVLGWSAPYRSGQPAEAAGRVGRHEPARSGTAGLFWLNLQAPSPARRCRPKADGSGASSRCCSSPA